MHLISNCCGTTGGKQLPGYTKKKMAEPGETYYDFTYEDAGLCASCGEHCEYLSEEDYEEARKVEILKPNI